MMGGPVDPNSFVQTELRKEAMRLHTRDQAKEGEQEAQTPFTVGGSVGGGGYSCCVKWCIEINTDPSSLSLDHPPGVGARAAGLPAVPGGLEARVRDL